MHSAGPRADAHPGRRHGAAQRVRPAVTRRIKVQFQKRGHADVQLSAIVDHSPLGAADAHPSDDWCPRTVTPPSVIDPFPDGSIRDRGCGAKRADRTYGDPILIDVVGP